MRGPFANHVEHLVHVQSRVLTERNGFAEALHQARDTNLIHHLRQLPRATLTKTGERSGKRHRHRLNRVKGGLIAATHDGQHAIFCACLASRDWRIYELKVEVFGGQIQFARHAGGGGRVVNKNRTRFHAGKGTLGPERDAAQIVIIADAAENEVGVDRRQTGCLCRF